MEALPALPAPATALQGPAEMEVEKPQDDFPNDGKEKPVNAS